MELKNLFNRIYQDYDKYFAIPAILILAATAVIGLNYATTGKIVTKGLDFTGGTEIQYHVNGSFQPTEIEKIFAANGRQDVSAATQTIGNQTLLNVQVPPPKINQTEAEQILEQDGYQISVESLRSISSAVSDQFLTQALLAFVMAFTIMSLVIFYAFKDLTPSLAVIFAAAGDIIIAVAGMNILGVPLTLGSLAALLMLIGYSVDTDIVLSTRVLKQDRKKLKDRIWSSILTGVTMSSGGIAGFTILYIVSTVIVGPSELSNIAIVMVIGLLADIPLTWLGNAIILKKYVNNEINTGVIRKWI
ncbi:MAG: protein translocase subunit SecF [Candidatus Nanohaloarchaea archaeon]